MTGSVLFLTSYSMDSVVFSSGVKRPVREPDHYHLLLGLRRNGGILHNSICLHGMHRDKFALTYAQEGVNK
jgi:hypothetical protein